MSRKLSKAELVAEIADVLGVESPRMSTGSTEPKEIFTLVNEDNILALLQHSRLFEITDSDSRTLQVAEFGCERVLAGCHACWSVVRVGASRRA